MRPLRILFRAWVRADGEQLGDAVLAGFGGVGAILGKTEHVGFCRGCVHVDTGMRTRNRSPLVIDLDYDARWVGSQAAIWLMRLWIVWSPLRHLWRWALLEEMGRYRQHGDARVVVMVG